MQGTPGTPRSPGSPWTPPPAQARFPPSNYRQVPGTVLTGGGGVGGGLSRPPAVIAIPGSRPAPDS